jgi:2',3'-cyclic-nucleotide 2'-phosphodiesterase (5'-nucleotidase family)
MRKIRNLFLTGLALLLSFQVFAQQGARQGRTTVIILHVNDMHAKIDNLPKLAYLADSLRKTNPFVFLVSAGDNFTGNPAVDMAADKGYPMIDLMNRCGFNVSAIGNHEFDLGQETLNKRFEQAKFPFICCNLKVDGGTLEQPNPFFILDVGNKIHIAVLGIIELNDKGIPDTHPSKVTGIRFTNGITKAKEYTWLKKQYGILIGLTHLGVDTDVRLADSMPEFDEIIGGHSHTLIEKPIVENGVMIVQDGSNLNYIGKTTLRIENGLVAERDDEVIPITALQKSDSSVAAMCAKYNDNEEFNKVIGIASTSLKGYDELGCLMTDALTHQLKADIAFLNQGGIRYTSLPQGPVRIKDIYKIDPFGNLVVTFKMSTEEMKSLISYSWNIEKRVDLQVSGMKYRITSDQKGNVIKVDLFDNSGNVLNAKKEYIVAVNSYIAASYRFTHEDPGTTGSITTAELLINYIKEIKKINYHGLKRVSQVIKP